MQYVGVLVFPRGNTENRASIWDRNDLARLGTAVLRVLGPLSAREAPEDAAPRRRRRISQTRRS